MPKCVRCFGDGVQYWDEDGRRQEMICYHCGGTGVVDDQTDWSDRIYAAAETRAIEIVEGWQVARAEDPEGEDMRFCAAENMMSLRDYMTTLIWEQTDHLLQEWDKLPKDELTQLVLEIEAKQEAKREAAPYLCPDCGVDVRTVAVTVEPYKRTLCPSCKEKRQQEPISQPQTENIPF